MRTTVNSSQVKPQGVHPKILAGVLLAHVALFILFLNFSANHRSLQVAKREKTPPPLVMVKMITTPVTASIVDSPQAAPVPIVVPDKPQAAVMPSVTPPQTKAAPSSKQAKSSTKTQTLTSPQITTTSETALSSNTAAAGSQNGQQGATGSGQGNQSSAHNGSENAPPVPPRAMATGQGTSLTPPKFGVAYLNNPPPKYPSMAKRMGEQGRVMLRVLVSVNGAAEDVKLLASSGSELLDDSALKAVRRWKFIPAKLGEAAVAAWVQVPVVFKLNQGDN